MGTEEELLEEALASYARVEPRAGIEQRVLHRIGSRHIRWPWLIPAFAVASAVVLIFAHRSERIPLPAPPVPAVQAARVEIPVAKPIVRGRFRSTRRREVFPSPSPLTNEERALLSLMDQAPDQTRAMLSQDIEPIRIEEITIQPLGE